MGRHRKSAKLERREKRIQAVNKLTSAKSSFAERRRLEPKLSIRQHATDTGVDFRRLTELINNPEHKFRDQINKEQSILPPDEAKVLVDWIVAQAERGFPLDYHQIEELANHLIRKVGQDLPISWSGVGQDWARRFCENHSEVLGTYWAKSLETTHANGLTEEHVREWFNLLTTRIEEAGVPINRLFQMDESGFQLSYVWPSITLFLAC